MKTSTKWLIAALLVAAYGWAGQEDYEEAVRAEKAYCERVAAGLHTDYDHLCPPGRAPEVKPSSTP